MLPALVTTTGAVPGRKPAPFQSSPSVIVKFGGNTVFSSNLVLLKTAPSSFAPVKSEPQMSPKQKSASTRFAFRKLQRRAPVRRAHFFICAPSNETSEQFPRKKYASVKSAPAKLAPFKSA